MQLDLQAITIQPLRQTFDNLKARFGDKPANRYQEGTYDIQQTFLYHYRPTWDPEREIFDVRRTKICMSDWYKLNDPRQFYYGTYAIARSGQQDGADATFELALDEGMVETLPSALLELIEEVLLPMRHLEWGANMNNTFISAYGYGTAINAACSFHAMDRLGIAQSISRVGLAIDGEAILDKAKQRWIDVPAWQGLRKYVENMFVMKDWFELFIAQNLILDGLIYPFLYTHVAKVATNTGSTFYSLATSFQREWFAETRRWVDAVTKNAVAESPENKALIQGWIDDYMKQGIDALAPLADHVFGDGTPQVLLNIRSDLATRLQKIGLTV